LAAALAVLAPLGATPGRPGPPRPEGAAAQPVHWAYVKPVRPELPTVRDVDWPRNPIDRFLLARLEQEGLSPSPPADRARLLRRVYLDLIGLPPSVAQVDAFLNDSRPGAYERVVDALLASPPYGERWARPWLDLARYADSNGFQRDGFREVWPYRDWVVNPFTRSLPFDQFPIAQISRALPPPATRTPAHTSNPRSPRAPTAAPPSTSRRGPTGKRSASTPSSTGSTRRPPSGSGRRLSAPSATTTSTTRSPCASITAFSPTSTT